MLCTKFIIVHCTLLCSGIINKVKVGEHHFLDQLFFIQWMKGLRLIFKKSGKNLIFRDLESLYTYAQKINTDIILYLVFGHLDWSSPFLDER